MASLCPVFFFLGDLGTQGSFWIQEVENIANTLKYSLSFHFFFSKYIFINSTFYFKSHVFQPEPHTNVCFAFCSRVHAAVSFRTSHSFDSKWVN